MPVSCHILYQQGYSKLTLCVLKLTSVLKLNKEFSLVCNGKLPIYYGGNYRFQKAVISKDLYCLLKLVNYSLCSMWNPGRLDLHAWIYSELPLIFFASSSSIKSEF